MKDKDFDPTKISKVAIDKVEPNDYNPKQKDTKEYRDVVESIRENGLKQPIFVREVEGNDKFVIVDGEQRWTAANELGYKEIYIYNLGNISENEAKAFTIWMEVAVPFDEIELAPLVVQLNQQGVNLPYTKQEIIDFSNMATFDFSDSFKDTSPVGDDLDFKTLSIKMTADQYDIITEAISILAKNENVSDGRALELLVADGLSGYQQTNYIPDGKNIE